MPTLAERLVDRLDRELQARRRELSELKLLYQGTKGARAASLARAGHVLAYSHWEGFTKECLASYLEYIEATGHQVGKLKDQFEAVTFARSIQTAENGFDVALKVLAVVRPSTERFKLDARALVKTGNLDAETLRSLLSFCALDYLPVYQTREKYIDSVLCGRRHRIAHGQLEPVQEADFYDVIEESTNLCNEVNDQVQEAVIYQHFLRQS